MEYLKDLGEDVCLSGGADGADLEWGRCAALLGHGVIHWSFPNHQSQAAEEDLVRLTDEELALAIPAVENAARTLGKKAPSRPQVARLIRRNYYQVAWSESCYAVTFLRDDVLPGGTAWAITMFQQLHPGNRNLWVFDQVKDGWFRWSGKGWEGVEGSPPRPRGVWAGIGSRELGENGRRAIRRVMGC